jgi:hypothetical protein
MLKLLHTRNFIRKNRAINRNSEISANVAEVYPENIVNTPSKLFSQAGFINKIQPNSVPESLAVEVDVPFLRTLSAPNPRLQINYLENLEPVIAHKTSFSNLEQNYNNFFKSAELFNIDKSNNIKNVEGFNLNNIIEKIRVDQPSFNNEINIIALSDFGEIGRISSGLDEGYDASEEEKLYLGEEDLKISDESSYNIAAGLLEDSLEYDPYIDEESGIPSEAFYRVGASLLLNELEYLSDDESDSYIEIAMPEIDPKVWLEIGASLLEDASYVDDKDNDFVFSDLESCLSYSDSEVVSCSEESENYISDDESYVHVEQDNFECSVMDDDWTYL